MLKQEVAVAEAPEDRDTGDSCVAGGLNVYIAVAYVNGLILSHSQFMQGSKDRVWRRLLADTLCFMLTNSYLDSVGEEMVAEFPGGCHHLITHHSDMAAPLVEFCKGLRNTVIGTGCIECMIHIIPTEGCESLFKERVSCTIRHCTLHQETDTIAHKTTHIVE